MMKTLRIGVLHDQVSPLCLPVGQCLMLGALVIQYVLVYLFPQDVTYVTIRICAVEFPGSDLPA